MKSDQFAEIIFFSYKMCKFQSFTASSDYKNLEENGIIAFRRGNEISDYDVNPSVNSPFHFIFFFFLSQVLFISQQIAQNK